MFSISIRMVVLVLFVSLISKVALMLLNPYQLSLLLSLDGLYSLFWGLRLDLTTVAILLSPIVFLMLLTGWLGWHSVVAKPLLFLAISWVVITTTADAIYMLEAGRHITFEVFTGSGLEDGLIATAFTSFFAQTITGTALLVIFGLVVFFTPLHKSLSKKISLGNSSVFFVIWALFATTAIRGGWWDAPQSPMSAYKIGDPKQAAMAWSAPYAITYYLSKGQKRAAQLKTQAATEQDFELLTAMPFNKGQLIKPTKTANVLVVLLESWNAFDLYSYAQQKNAAPNFDLLREQSLTPTRFYADAYRTVEGMFATFCSFPNPIGGGVAGTQLQAADYQCLPNLLNEMGWDTRFIQGSGKGTVGAFAQTLGFTESYGKTDYDFSGTMNYWGYMDDDIYSFTLDKLNSMTKPFLLTVNTGTTHDSYLPEAVGFKFGEEDRTAIRRSVLHHADAALDRFLAKLPEVLTEPTLVVLVSDHTARAAPEGLQQNAIPFLMYATDGSLPLEKLPISAGQLDIAPTIIDWLGGNVPWFTGQSLMIDSYQGFAHYSSGQSVNWIKDQNLVRFDVTQDVLTSERVECFSIADNGIDLTPQTCISVLYKKMLQEAQAYTRYTQGLLFEGKTSEFAEIF